jgi:branched-chain amino acid transport system substrate-binding protein
MLQQNKIDLFTGPLPSNVALAVAPALFAAKVPFVSSNPGPSQFAGAQCNAYFIGLHYQNDAWDEAMGMYATQAGHKSAYLIAPNYPAGRDHLTGFKRRFEGEVVAEVYSKLGQLDYAAELAEIRAKRPDAVYFFLPGGMGINFIKQFLAAGLPKETKLLLGPTSGEPDTIQAVGEPMLGMVSAAQWAPDLPSAANQKFVAEFRKAFNRHPSVFAAQAYDTMLAIDAAVKEVKGNVLDREGVARALKNANFESVRGRIKLGNNNFPIQDYYLRSVVRDSDGSLVNKTIGTPLKAYSDAYHALCKMK